MRRSILALGEPLAGKTTALVRFNNNYPLESHFISTGMLLRDFMEEFPDHPLTVNELVPMFAKGVLASDTTTAAVFNQYLAQADLPEDPLYLLDGVIRKLSQIDFEDTLDLNVLSVLYFDTSAMPDEELMKRAASRGRAEETPEVVRKRRETYRAETLPLRDYYEARGILRIVDAYQPKDHVYKNVEDILLSFVSQ